ncbi:hypothetical protein [Sulfurimonas sp.]|uniref:hypothetical protein n=1 Tax=Sulfurimonas sp. TaxID=2022749 RepID=UPI0025D5DF69|nr:hypothetical protein [Sulfurimonas sp.]MBW6487475.1 hypothetical protein [Sulfurimonas sp.]
MDEEPLYNKKIEEIVSEIQAQHGLEKNDAHKIINDSIAAAYQSGYPIVLEEDGIYAVYDDKKEADKLKFVKLKYSKQKSKAIVQDIQTRANRVFLNMQRDKIVEFLKTKKNYLHASYLYTDSQNKIYNLFYDKNFKYQVQRVKAKTPKDDKVKKRVYIDFTTAIYHKETLFFSELKEIRTLRNLKEMTKDLSREIYEKIGKKIWIEVLAVNILKNEAYLHLPYKTIGEIVEYIKKRFEEIFGVKIIFIKKKR